MAMTDEEDELHQREARLRASLCGLYEIDPGLRRIEAAAGPLPFRARPEGFPALIRTLVGQQLSPVAAEAIFRRLGANGEALAPDYFLSRSDAELRAAGLSGQKIAYCRGLAEAVTTGALSFESLRSMPDDEAIAALTRLKGIGRWTAEIYLLFAIGREDVWPAADLALQVACMHHLQLPDRPKERHLRDVAEAWRPYRSAAARLFWHYHGWLKASAAATPL